jgi:hypothetical protein
MSNKMRFIIGLSALSIGAIAAVIISFVIFTKPLTIPTLLKSCDFEVTQVDVVRAHSAKIFIQSGAYTSANQRANVYCLAKKLQISPLGIWPIFSSPRPLEPVVIEGRGIYKNIQFEAGYFWYVSDEVNCLVGKPKRIWGIITNRQDQECTPFLRIRLTDLNPSW